MMLHVRRVSEYNKKNPGLKKGLVKLYSTGGLLDVCPKSQNVPH